MSSMTPQLIDRYKSSPSWLKAIIILTLVYLSHRIWTQITRTRRELQAASWILSERRKAGIPDSDKRPFKIAKAAVEAARKKNSSSDPTSTRSPSTSLPIPRSSNRHPPSPQAPLSLPHQSNLPTPSPAISNSVETVKSRDDNQDSVTLDSNASHPGTKNDRLDTPLGTTPGPEDLSNNSNNLKPTPIACHSPQPTSNQPLIGRSLQKRVAPLSTDGSDPDQSEIEEENPITTTTTTTTMTTTRNRKKAKTQKNPSSPQVESEPAFPGNFTDNKPSSRKPNGDGSTLKKFQSSKKRILSDCVGDMDNDQAARIKKGRSEKMADANKPPSPKRGTDLDTQVSMQVEPDEEAEGEEDEEDELEEDEEEEEEGEEGDGDNDDAEQDKPNEEKNGSDAERYMTGDDGQKKKLVQVRLNPPESNHSPGEGATEYRWVTRRQFQDLEQREMLLMEDDQWDGGSTTSVESLDSRINHLSTPSKRTSSITIEKGPIWSIEGKKTSSKSSLSASDISPKPSSASRPRNSLGRIRLSLPPTPASPLQRSRTRLLSPLRPSIS